MLARKALRSVPTTIPSTAEKEFVDGVGASVCAGLLVGAAAPQQRYLVRAVLPQSPRSSAPQARTYSSRG
jgi:hypothetical protein